MPRDITHVILADEAAKIVKDKDIFNHLNAFHMGSIAVDTFFYSLSSQLSSRLHGGWGDDTRAVVLKMLEATKKEKDAEKAAEQKAFICGYLCHVAADATYHPLINSVAKSEKKDSSLDMSDEDFATACHRYAETWLDLSMLKNKNLSFENFRPFRKILVDIDVRNRVDYFFTDCYQKTFNASSYNWRDNLDKQALFHNSMTRQFFVDKVTQNPTVAGMMQRLDKILGGKLKPFTSGFYEFSKDVPEQLTAGSFVHPVTGEVIHKSLNDLENDTIKYSVKFMHAVDDYVKSGRKEDFLNAVPNVNLDTGIITPNVRAKTLSYEDNKKVISVTKGNEKVLSNKNGCIDVSSLARDIYKSR